MFSITDFDLRWRSTLFLFCVFFLNLTSLMPKNLVRSFLFLTLPFSCRFLTALILALFRLRIFKSNCSSIPRRWLRFFLRTLISPLNSDPVVRCRGGRGGGTAWRERRYSSLSHSEASSMSSYSVASDSRLSCLPGLILNVTFSFPAITTKFLFSWIWGWGLRWSLSLLMTGLTGLPSTQRLTLSW